MDTDRVYNNVFIIKFESVCFSIISYDLVCVCIERVINLKQRFYFEMKFFLLFKVLFLHILYFQDNLYVCLY